jgi:hypothetical protein
MSLHEKKEIAIAAMIRVKEFFKRDQFINKIIECTGIKQGRTPVKDFGRNL